MNKYQTYIIAEAGVNHNGSFDLALKLCDAAKYAGVNAVKFQTWKTEKIITNDTAQADYQKENSKKQQSQFEMLKSLELGQNDFIKIKEYCQNIGIDFLSTADEAESLDFLISIGIKLLKIGSGEITNIPYLRYIASKKLPVILSTGMATLADVDRAYNIMLRGGVPNIKLLHCTTNYPCPVDEVNLKAMQTLHDAFKCDVGYSDHTLGIEVPIAAVAMGAKIIEKHFTLDKNMSGPDHKASLVPNEFKEMVSQIRNIEQALGDGIKRPNKSEIKISDVVLKRIVASRNIKKGEILSDKNMTVKRAKSGVSSIYWDLLYGTSAIKDYVADESIKIFE